MSAKKVLLISLSEIIENSVIEYNVDSKILAKTLSIAQETGLKPILGSTLYDETLNAVYNFVISGTPINSKYQNIITASKPYLTSKTTAEFIVTNNYKFTDKGIMKLNDNSASNISEGDLQSVKDYYDNLISTYKQDLVQFLKDAHLIDYQNDVQISSEASGWFLGVPVSVNPIKTETIQYSDYIEPVVDGKFTYQQLAAFNNILLVNVQEIIGYSVIQDNVDLKLLSKTIETVQQVNLKPILGNKLFYSYLNAINNFIVSGTTIPALYRDLETFVKPYIINKTVAEFLIPNQYKVTSKGILKLNDVSATNISEGDLTAIKDYYDNLSTTYKENLISFLKKYNLTECYGDLQISSDATGWFLSGQFKGSPYNLDVEEAYNNDTYTTAINFNNPTLTLTDNLGGTLSTTIPLNLYVPYTGATSDVILGQHDLYTKILKLYDNPEVGYGTFRLSDNIFGGFNKNDEPVFSIEQGYFRFNKSSTIASTFINTNLTQGRNYYLPNASGNLPLTINGITANTFGNITLSIPDSNNFVPYTGATKDVDLGTNDLTAGVITSIEGIVNTFFQSDTEQFDFYFPTGDNQISFYGRGVTGTGAKLQILFDNLSDYSYRTYNWPNDNGTFTLSVNGYVANTAGNITIPVQSPITLTTTGTTGPSTLSANILNIPQYGGTASQWTTTGTSIYYTNNVLIGTTSDDGSKLRVVGNTSLKGTNYFDGGTVLMHPSVYGAAFLNYKQLLGNGDFRLAWSPTSSTWYNNSSPDIIIKRIGSSQLQFTNGVTGYTSISVGSIGINTTSIETTAALQVDSTTQGFLPPRMTSFERLGITSPAVGLMVYQTDGVEGWYGYKSTGWKSFGTV